MYSRWHVTPALGFPGVALQPCLVLSEYLAYHWSAWVPERASHRGCIFHWDRILDTEDFRKAQITGGTQPC